MRTSLTSVTVLCVLYAGCTAQPENLRGAGQTCAADDECSGNLCYESLCYDPAADEDLDGLTNAVEAGLGTVLTLADSDGDGRSDFEEVGERLDAPLDSDGDGTIDAIESTLLVDDDDGDCVVPQDDSDDDSVDDLACCCGESCAVFGIEVADIVDYTCDPQTGQITCVFSEVADLDLDGLLPQCDADDDGDGVDDGDDCAPENPSISPEVEELCDGIDNDCDEAIDEAWAELTIKCLTAHPDCGGVAFYVCNETKDGVLCPVGASQLGTPCDDGNPQTVGDQCDSAGNCGGAVCPDGGACMSASLEDGECVYHPLSGMCVVAGECYAEGDTKPGSPCKQCDPAKAQENWTVLEAGTSCDDGNACTAGDVCGPEAVCHGEVIVSDDCLYDCAITHSLVGTSIQAASNASGHAVFAGDYGYVLQNREQNGDEIELSIVNLSDGSDPQIVQQPNLQTGGFSNSGALNDVNGPRRGLISAEDDILYIASATGFQLVDVSEPGDAQTVKTHSISGQLYGMAHHPYEPVIYGAAITWGGEGSFVTINLAGSPDSLISKLHAAEYGVETYGVAVGPDHNVYLVGADLSLQWYDITEPLQPVLKGSFPGIEAPTDNAEALVEVQGSLAVAASTHDGYRLLDISNVAEVTVVYEGASPSEIHAVAFFEGYLLLASKDQGLVILDIAEPSSPTVVTTIELEGTPRGVHVVGHRVFVSTNTHFAQVIDLTVPCADGDLCTLDGCHEQLGCDVVADTHCDDLDPCTIDSCDAGTGCVFTEDITCIEAGAGAP
ncbi:MAG: hypothetical protein ACPGU1_16730 [Myxococcota bacterium]